MSEILLPMFSSRIFMILILTFKYLFYFKFILVYGVKKAVQFHLFPLSVQFSQYHLLNRLSLPHCMFLPLWQILVDYEGMVVFLGSLFCFTDLYVCFYAYCFDYCGPVVQFVIRYCDSYDFVLLSQDCFGYSGSFVISYKFLEYLFQFCEIHHWYFERYLLNLYIALGSMDILMILILPIQEYGMCFHLFVSSIFFFSVLQFSEYRSFTSLVKFIPKYLIFLLQQ